MTQKVFESPVPALSASTGMSAGPLEGTSKDSNEGDASVPSSPRSRDVKSRNESIAMRIQTVRVGEKCVGMHRAGAMVSS